MIRQSGRSTRVSTHTAVRFCRSRIENGLRACRNSAAETHLYRIEYWDPGKGCFRAYDVLRSYYYDAQNAWRFPAD